MKKEPFNPELLDLVKVDNEYIIYHGDSPLLTKKNKTFTHTEQRLLKNIINDIQVWGIIDRAGISAYRLYEFQLDYIENGVDPVAENFNKISDSDDFILLKTGKRKEYVKWNKNLPPESFDKEYPLFNTLFWGFSSVVINLNDFIAENIQQMDPESELDEDHPFILLLKQLYIQMPDEKRSAVNLLSFVHRSGIVLPLLFVLNRLTASEYARGILSIHLKNQSRNFEGGFPEIEFPYRPVSNDESGPLEVFLSCFRDAADVKDYLSLFILNSVKHPLINELIANGESSEIEFKSTFRWDLKAGKTNPYVERASLKTISAFLNSSGGDLLIGVRDDGSIEGIESDRFVSEDKFLLHLWTLIRTSLGRDVSPYIRTILEKVNERTVCIVTCSKSPKPVFLRQPGFDEELYIRVGPSSNALDISEALRYITLHF